MFVITRATRVSALFLVLGAAAIAADAKDIWMETRIAGQPSGYVHEVLTQSADGHLSTVQEAHTVINRLGKKVEINVTAKNDESADGRLRGIHSEVSSSAQSVVTDGVIAEAVIHLKMATGGKTYDRDLPFTGTLLGPEGGRRLSAERLHKTGDSVAFQTFSPELGTVATVTRTVLGTEGGRLKAEEEMSGMPGKATVWLDSDGRAVRRVQASPFGDIEIARTSKDVALTATNGATLPPEAFTKSVVKSNIRLPHERSIEAIRIRITHHKPELGWPDFTADNQTVVEKTPTTIVLDVRRPELTGARRAVRYSREAKAELKPYLAPNALLQSDDATIQQIAHKVAPGGGDAFATAMALRDWTSANMHFDAGIAIAPASEVARDHGGTCFGYSVLLGALARAAGVPSRMKMGFVYMGGIWGGHAWDDVYVNDRWIPIDAALPSTGIADAARFSFFTSSLEEGSITGIGSLAQLFGSVDIQVLSYTIGGRTYAVPGDAKAFAVNGNVYENASLQLAFAKPEGFRFTKTDATWPEPVLVEMEGPNGQSVELRVVDYSPERPNAEELLAKSGVKGDSRRMKVAGHDAVRVDVDGKAAVAVLDGDQTWVLVASGPDAAKVLDAVAVTLRLGQPNDDVKSRALRTKS